MDIHKLTPSQRATPLGYTLNPGFVHHRLIQQILGPTGIEIIDEKIRQIPDMPDGLKQIRIDVIYTQTLVLFCGVNSIPCLEEMIMSGKGKIFCSTEQLLPCPEIYDADRVISIWQPISAQSTKVEFHYSTRHIASDTIRARLKDGGTFSIVALLSKESQVRMIFEPLVIGSPYLMVDTDSHLDFLPEIYSHNFFEHFIDDFDEFSRIREVPEPSNSEQMRHISEFAFKSCLQEILGDTAGTDWGGEGADYYSAHIHLNGMRKTASFLLKGPAKFKPMGLNHLGKNNDQIVRLSHQPADVLFVQHSHDIQPQVRETLRVFAVQPSNARRYCLIDGRDSLRLLLAYDLYDKAMALSKK